ncbi:MAG: hypothetical protein AB7Q97_09725 [Gammaproteobacteria bacterium]
MPPIRVILWATGKVGAAAGRTLARDPRFRIVGARVYGEDKHGRDVGELLGVPVIGVKATTDTAEILRTPAEAVVHAPRGHHRSEQHDLDVCALLESGKNVLSTCGYFNCAAFGDEHATRMHAAGVRGNATLSGVGMSPGFVAERMLAALTGACVRIDALSLIETIDCTGIAEWILERMGFGATPEKYAGSGLANAFDDFYGQVVHTVMRTLGAAPERIECRHECIAAGEDFGGAALPIPRGHVQATARRWLGYRGGRPFFTMELRWLVGTIPGWSQGSGWDFAIDGTPPLRMRLGYGPASEGYDATAMGYDMMSGIIVNTLPAIVAAPPGIFTAPVFAPYRFH